jgi:hypothetical protein
MAIKIKNSTIIDDSRNLVDVGISTVTSLSIGSNEVISSSRQLKNIASLDATTTATIESAIANAPNTFTDLNVTGISTLNVASANSLNVVGVVTAGGFDGGPLSGSSGSFTQINVSGVGTITTFDSNTGTIDFLSGTNINASGIVTAGTFSGNLKNTLTLNTSGTGLSGSTTFNNSGSSTFTVTSNATSSNTNSTIVARDSSGNFSAGIITATTFSGNLALSNITGLGTNVSTFLATPSSSNLASAVTNETGSGSLVFATSPTLVTPVLGAATATSVVVGSAVTITSSGINAITGIITASTIELGNASDTTISRAAAGRIAVEGVNVVTISSTDTFSNKTISFTNNTVSFTSAELATACSNETGSGSLVFATSPTLVNPVLGSATATSINISGIVTANTYNVGSDVGISTTRTTVASTSATTIDSFAIATFRSARVQVQITQSTNYQASDVLIIHNGTTADVIEYGSIATNDYLGTFSATVSGGNCLLQINMNSASSATVKVLSQRITV